MKIIPERASHWYFPSGVPCHQVQAKSGNGLRDATLRDARTLGLYPSVTSILNIIAKPQLEAWKQEQCIAAALTLPRQRESFEAWAKRWSPADGMDMIHWAYDHPPRFTEDEHTFALRVVEDSQAQASDAADFGRRIHKAIEGTLLNVPTVFDADIEPHLEHVREWVAHNVVETYSAECIVTNQAHGYAGTMDLHCELIDVGEAVIDFKTQGIKPGKPATFYDEWFLQLAAYGGAIARTREPNAVKPKLPACVSVVVDSAKPGPVAVKQWEDPDQGYFLFRCAFELWKNQKGYNPICQK